MKDCNVGIRHLNLLLQRRIGKEHYNINIYYKKKFLLVVINNMIGENCTYIIKFEYTIFWKIRKFLQNTLEFIFSFSKFNFYVFYNKLCISTYYA